MGDRWEGWVERIMRERGEREEREGGRVCVRVGREQGIEREKWDRW